MSRTANKKTAPADMPEILPAVEARITTGQELAAQQRQAATELARKLGYEGSLEPDALENSAREAIRRLNLGVMEVGAYFLLMREQCAHGEFLARLERLDTEPRVAQQYMQITLRFASNADAHSHLIALGKTKLLEMLVLDNDEIKQLTDGDSVRGVTLDDIDRMSTRELRAALRKEKLETARQQAVNTELHQEVLQHKVKGKVVAQTDWPAALETVSDQVSAAGRKLATALSELEACRIAIFTAGEPLNDAGRASFEAALGHVAELYEQALARAERSIERERATFDNTLGAFAEGA